MTTHLNPRELNRLIAEKVMGWVPGNRWGNGNGQWTLPDGSQGPTWDHTPRFSTDTACAFQVRDKIATMPFSVRRDFRIALQRIISERIGSGDLIHDTEIILHVTARDICEAALENSSE